MICCITSNLSHIHCSLFMITYTKLLSAASVCEVFIFEGKVIFKNLNVSYQFYMDVWRSFPIKN